MNANEELDSLDTHLTHALKLAAGMDWFSARHELRQAQRIVEEKCEQEAEQMLPKEKHNGRLRD